VAHLRLRGKDELEGVMLRKFNARFINIDILHQNGISYTFKLFHHRGLFVCNREFELYMKTVAMLDCKELNLSHFVRALKTL
jgi:hypothetical protein